MWILPTNKSDLDYTLMYGIILLLLVTILLIVFRLIYQNRKKDPTALEACAMHEREKRNLQARLEEKDIIISRILKDVHDNVAQVATVAGWHIRQLEKECYDSAQIKIIGETKEAIYAILNNARDICLEVNKGIEEFGLIRTIETELSYVQRMHKINYDLHLDVDDLKINTEKAQLIYGIMKQAVNNIIEHAKASIITVGVIRTGVYFKMTIADDGIGISSCDADERGIGLKQMAQRASLLNGKFTIVTGERGTYIALLIEHIESL
jgi:two-component system, NarL family, sensor kinase